VIRGASYAWFPPPSPTPLPLPAYTHIPSLSHRLHARSLASPVPCCFGQKELKAVCVCVRVCVRVRLCMCVLCVCWVHQRWVEAGVIRREHSTPAALHAATGKWPTVDEDARRAAASAADIAVAEAAGQKKVMSKKAKASMLKKQQAKAVEAIVDEFKASHKHFHAIQDTFDLLKQYKGLGRRVAAEWKVIWLLYQLPFPHLLRSFALLSQTRPVSLTHTFSHTCARSLSPSLS